MKTQAASDRIGRKDTSLVCTPMNVRYLKLATKVLNWDKLSKQTIHQPLDVQLLHIKGDQPMASDRKGQTAEGKMRFGAD